MEKETFAENRRAAYAFGRMRLAINRAIHAQTMEERKLSKWWVAGWICFCQIKCKSQDKAN
uniref:Uncharacterized protein n=1 Tax=bacterium enrichment culture clone 2b(2010) TaxID=795324 RepID=D9CGK6_9BACT|nr:hypothetical protein pHB2b_gp10 [bacterium enrichment culture clone 2b(2010)]